MSDFTGFGMQDHFRAIVAEREREIAASSWRRKWKKLHAGDAEPQCCSADENSRHSEQVVPRQALTPNT